MFVETALEKKGIRFRGSSSHVIDPKGRMIVPARFRDVLQEEETCNLIVTRFDKALYAYTYKSWEVVEAKILSRVEQSSGMRKFKRVFIGGAYDLSIDKQNRILIPPPLRKYASLVKDVELVGVVDHFEIWSKEEWSVELQSLDDELQNTQLRNEVAQLGL